MNETKVLVNRIISAAQDKKAKKIVTVDLSELPGSICKYFIITEGNTPNQVSAIAEEIIEKVKSDVKERPLTTDGMREARWIGIDYGTVIVHIFVPELREFYNLEHLWADAKLDFIPDLD